MYVRTYVRTYEYDDYAQRNIANSSFVVGSYRTRWRGLGAELQIDRIEGVPRALKYAQKLTSCF